MPLHIFNGSFSISFEKQFTLVCYSTRLADAIAKCYNFAFTSEPICIGAVVHQPNHVVHDRIVHEQYAEAAFVHGILNTVANSEYRLFVTFFSTATANKMYYNFQTISGLSANIQSIAFF